jgi:hypothetical protein
MKTNIFKHRHAGTELESRYNSAVHKTHHHADLTAARGTKHIKKTRGKQWKKKIIIAICRL